MFIKQKAFTLVEILIVVAIIGVIAVFTVCSTISSGDIQRNQVKSLSKTFYSEVEYSYLQILSRETKGMNISEVMTASEEDNSKKLAQFFATHLDSFETSCDSLPKNPYYEEYYEDEMVCAYTNRRMYVGFYMAENCSKTYDVISYYQDETNTPKTVNNACGYMLYAPKGSKGVFGEDLFVIALGKRGLK